ncbi:MAG: glycosyltransferase family 39 protein, partial [Planctomycetes bacterium]|nr:glycosyltransferase family 39 protein [Planctomycetota bacterium]
MTGLANSENGSDGVEGIVETGWVQWVCLAIAAVILVAFRMHAFDLPLETDECNYAYIGGRLLAGDRLYVDVWDHQPPGVFALFAGAIALFGDAPEVFRWMAVAFSLASLGLVYGIALRCGGRGAAVLAALLFALASSDPGTAGEGCNREIYMNTLVLAAWYLALRSGGSSGWAVFGSGLALGLGSALKTILAVHWGFLALWIGWWAWTRAGDRNRAAAVARSLVLFGAGPAIVWMAVFGYFAATSRLAESIEAILLFNLSYSEGTEGFFARFARFFAPVRHPFIFDSALPLWLGAAAALLWLVADAVMSRSAQVVGILGLVLAGFVATCLPAQFWPHYYYLLIPPMAVAVAVGVARLPQPADSSLSS